MGDGEPVRTGGALLGRLRRDFVTGPSPEEAAKPTVERDALTDEREEQVSEMPRTRSPFPAPWLTIVGC